MKTVFPLLFLLVISANGIAQPKENYRSRNHKLNRNYIKSINTKQHQVAVYELKETNPDESQLKKNHQLNKTVSSKKLVMKLEKRKSREMKKSDYRDQKSTFRGSTKKKGKNVLSYITMVLALSLFMVN